MQNCLKVPRKIHATLSYPLLRSCQLFSPLKRCYSGQNFWAYYDFNASTKVEQMPTKIDYRGRQNRAAAFLDGGALLLIAQPTAYRNSTVEHHYRQDSFFHYLTGFEEPEAAFLFLSHHAEGDRAYLFLRDKDPHAELWEGRRLGPEAALRSLPVDRTFSFKTFWDKLPGLLGDATSLHYHFGTSVANDEKVIAALTQHRRMRARARAGLLPVHDALEVAGRLRLIKESAEVERMRKAAAITGQTFRKVYAAVRPGMNEKEVYGLIAGEFLQAGGDMESYGTIIAGGRNACILHYRENNMALADGDLLLIDAGAQFEYYASDVTRTFPVGKRFSPAQKSLYEIVLAAQMAAIGKATVGSTLPAVHEAALHVLVDGLRDLKLVEGSRDEVIEKQTYRRFYPHSTSHWIGMDVHDVGEYTRQGNPVPLESGMYFSVEPGLYIAPDDEHAPPAFRGIGIRIEDDVLVTNHGPDVLTAAIAKDPTELENRW